MTSSMLGQNILDLFLTSNPTSIGKIIALPGLSEHDIVQAELNVKPKITKQVPRDILSYKKLTVTSLNSP